MPNREKGARPKDTDQIQQLLDEARHGSKDAALALFDRHEDYFRAIIGGKLHPKVRRVLDADDLLQEARIKLFTAEIKGSVFNSPKSFLAFAARVTLNAAYNIQHKHWLCRKRDLRRQMSLDEATARYAEVCRRHQQEAMAAVENEMDWQEFLGQQPPPVRTVFVMRRAGYTQSEIAGETGLAERTVRGQITRDAADAVKRLKQETGARTMCAKLNERAPWCMVI